MKAHLQLFLLAQPEISWLHERITNEIQSRAVSEVKTVSSSGLPESAASRSGGATAEEGGRGAT